MNKLNELKPRVEILLSEYEKLKDYEKENQRLNNVLNELEKWLSKEYMSGYYEELYRIGLNDCYNKLNELKESGK